MRRTLSHKGESLGQRFRFGNSRHTDEHFRQSFEPVHQSERDEWVSVNRNASCVHKLTISKKVLVVEDHADLLFILEKMLTFFGWDTVLAASAREALNKLELHLPSVILMDMRMPEMNGFELARILKAHPVYRNIPILAASAYSGRPARERCLAAGCDDFISKPFAISALQKVLTDLVSPERQNRCAGSDSRTSLTADNS
jgi:CheY-like chemotaxis protein